LGEKWFQTIIMHDLFSIFMPAVVLAVSVCQNAISFGDGGVLQ